MEDFYSVLGLRKECSDSDIKNAYKKLAMRWHPDRCLASGNLKFIEESKRKFQSIQEAYSVLSNANKRFMYDLGLYKNDDDDDDDDLNEMGDFLGEMVDLMAQTKPNENAKAETFEDLQVLFQAMVQDNMQAFNSASQYPASNSRNNSATTSSKRNCVDINSCYGWEKMDFTPAESHGQSFCLGAFNSASQYPASNSRNNSATTSSKRNCVDINSCYGWENMDFRPVESHGQSFCLGAEGGLEDSRCRIGSSRRRTTGKQKLSSQHMSSRVFSV